MLLANRLKKAAWARGGGGITSPTHPDLVAMYTMDNISGTTLIDETGNGNDAGIDGATVVSGKIDSALSFDGSNDYVRRANGLDVPDLSTFAMSVWVMVDSVNLFDTLFGHNVRTAGSGDDRNSGAYIRATNWSEVGGVNRIYGAYVLSNNESLTDSNGFSVSTYSANIFGPEITLGQYYHVVYQVIGGNSAELWVDNVLVGTVSSSQSIQYSSEGRTHGLTLGCDIGRSSFELAFANWSDCKQDMNRFFNRTLTSAEISDLYNGGAGA